MVLASSSSRFDNDWLILRKITCYLSIIIKIPTRKKVRWKLQDSKEEFQIMYFENFHLPYSRKFKRVLLIRKSIFCQKATVHKDRKST